MLINKKSILLGIFLGVLFNAGLVNTIKAQAASLYLSPRTNSYTVGSTFQATVKVDTAGVAMNAAEATIVFDFDKLEAVSVSKSGSILSLWTQNPIFSNSNGTINFGGGLPTPGFNGSSGTLMMIVFKAKMAGLANVSFSSGAVLADDGRGTNILASTGSASYNLIPRTIESVPSAPSVSALPSAPLISSSTHPEENKWYANSNPKFIWELPSGVNGVSVYFSESPVSNPGSFSDGLITTKEYKDIRDGKWYFHIKFRNQFGWGAITHRAVLVDTTPPKSFKIEVEREDPTDPQPQLQFLAQDDVSGVARYEVEIDDVSVVSVLPEDLKQNLFKMPIQAPGKHKIVVKAFDEAGNFSQAETDVIIESIRPPQITEYPARLQDGDNLIIRGKGLAESVIWVFVQREGETPSKGEVKSDKNGNWSYIYEKTVKKGVYRIWAQQTDKRGAVSLPSEKYTIAVELPPLLRFGALAFDYLTLMATFILIILGIIIAILYAWHRVASWRRRLRKEVTEAEESAKAAFEALREEVEDKLESLEKVTSQRELTAEEKRISRDLKHAIKTAETYIEKEIKDVVKELE